MTTTTPTARRKTPIWAKLLLVLFVLLLIGGAAVGGVALGKFLGAYEERNVQVIRSITREEQVVLVTAGVTDLKTISTEGLKVEIPGLDILNFTIPGTVRSVLIRYDFDAKLGIEGKDVRIEPSGENAYRVVIPEFTLIGYDDPTFSLAKEENGIFSWTTPEIDKFDLIETALSDKSAAATIEGARPVLEEQARTFYGNIIHAIDPSITLTFEFAQ